jgi:hypothetical protein
MINKKDWKPYAVVASILAIGAAAIGITLLVLSPSTPDASSIVQHDGYTVVQVVHGKQLSNKELSWAAGEKGQQAELVFVVKPQYVKDIPQYKRGIAVLDTVGAGIQVSVDGNVVRSTMTVSTYDQLFG